MATVRNKDGNDIFSVDTHLPSKLEKIADGLDTLNTNVEAQTAILNDIKTNTTPAA